MRVLTVAGDVPWPPVGGARTRNSHLATALAAHHDVVVAALEWGGPGAPAPDGVELRTVPWELPPLHRALEGGDEDAWAELSAPDAEPYGVGYFASPRLEQLLHDLCCSSRPDVAVLSETAMARFRHCLPPDVPVVLDLHDVHAIKQQRAGDVDQAERLRRFEAAAAADAAVTVCVSELEALAAREVLRAPRVEVVPNGVDTAHFVAADGPGDDDHVVFTGSLHTRENVEAVLWFAESVLPLVRARRPGVQLHVVGSRPRAQVRQLAGAQLHVHPDVPDTVPFLHRAGTVVVPLLHGGGTRLKVLEAAATGRSVVTTRIGVEGLALRDGVEVDVADGDQAFADAVVRLCADRGLRRARGDAARRAAASYDWSRIGRHWCSVVESVA